ncbi:uncharacterized protein [Nicotiana sylvestris]|uniref:uncharacterized protein n=1 Tax=Nicotiana sylvestris TaxID=4096 RepID=UPI00388C6C6F
MLQVAEFTSFTEISVPSKPKLQIPMRWLPSTNHYKLNIDGAYDKNNQTSGTAGIIRDHHSNWITGFAQKAAATSALHAEILTLIAGLEFSFTKNLFPTLVEKDSQIENSTDFEDG